MMLKASKRGGARDLGKHLLKAENEHVEIHEIRGFVADNVVEAFVEAYAVSRGTKCSKFLFSLSLSPPEMEKVPVAAFEAALESIETKLNLTGQPRVVIFHEKEGRRHAHCVWSRIDAEKMTAIDLPHFKLKLQDISRKLYIEHGWKMPDGLIDPALRNPLNFDRQEWFQAKRTGRDPRDIKAVFQQCWAASDSGKAFRQALEQRGYFLARGDRRAVVALDVHGEVYAVSRWVGITSKQVVARMGDLDSLPIIAEVKERLAERVRTKLSGFIDSIAADFARVAQTMEARRIAMVEQHRAARRELQSIQDRRWIDEARVRSAHFRKGLLGLWDRVTGQHTKLRAQNEQEVSFTQRRDAAEKQTLVDQQLEERQRLQREIKHERNLHLRETTRLHRQIAGKERSDDGGAIPRDDRPTSADMGQRRRIRREMSGP